jgi:predicted Rossmann fold flavoprotein
VSLSGAALAVEISTGQKKNKTVFLEDLLFTHRGLSGPAVLQISSYWQAGTPIKINLVPQENLSQRLIESKQQSKKLIANEISQWLPSRLADTWTEQNPAWQKPICDAQDKALLQLAEKLNQWELQPSGTEGYAKAEVMAGGVDTRDLSSQTMESSQKGLYFIGEVVDVTGWLGGYNFQWAWSSAFVCANALKQQLQC